MLTREHQPLCCVTVLQSDVWHLFVPCRTLLLWGAQGAAGTSRVESPLPPCRQAFSLINYMLNLTTFIV